jgi:hypothetical protein
VLDDVVEDSLAHFLSPFFGRVRPGERVVAGGAAPVLAPKRIWILEDWRGGWPAVQTP